MKLNAEELQQHQAAFGLIGLAAQGVGNLALVLAEDKENPDADPVALIVVYDPLFQQGHPIARIDYDLAERFSPLQKDALSEEDKALWNKFFPDNPVGDDEKKHKPKRAKRRPKKEKVHDDSAPPLSEIKPVSDEEIQKELDEIYEQFGPKDGK